MRDSMSRAIRTLRSRKLFIKDRLWLQSSTEGVIRHNVDLIIPGPKINSSFIFELNPDVSDNTEWQSTAPSQNVFCGNNNVAGAAGIGKITTATLSSFILSLHRWDGISMIASCSCRMDSPGKNVKLNSKSDFFRCMASSFNTISFSNLLSKNIAVMTIKKQL